MTKRVLFIVLPFLLFILGFPSGLTAGEPYCHVRHFDESDGLSEREVRRIVQDRNRVIWMATWSGLCRFDGYEFRRIRPGINDEARCFSDRVGDIMLTASGNLYCRVDDNLLLFDVTTYHFSDLGTKMSAKLGRNIAVRNFYATETPGQTMIRTRDEKYVLFSDSDPIGTAKLYNSKPNIRTAGPNNRQLGDVPPYPDSTLVYSRLDRNGGTQLITRSGKVLYRPAGAQTFSTLADLHAPGKLNFGITDTSGNVWLRSEEGAYCLKIGVSNFDFLPGTIPSIVKATARDRYGRLLVSYSDDETVALYSTPESSPLYINAAGSLSSAPVPFDAHVYSILPLDDGRILLGCKPEGMMQLTPRPDGGFNVSNFMPTPDRRFAPAHEAIYDMKFDRRCRLWIATLGGGIDIIDNPKAPNPTFRHLGDLPGFPERAKRVRRVLPINDSLTIAATTGGLLAINMVKTAKGTKYTFTLHASEPGRINSLGNIATMDVLVNTAGQLIVATETDGLNILDGPVRNAAAQASFIRLNENRGAISDATLALTQIPGSENLLVTAPYCIFSLLPDRSTTRILTPFVKQDNIRLTESTPIFIGSDRWLMGTSRGAMTINPYQLAERSLPTSIVVTSARIGARPDSLLSAMTDTVILNPHERSLTLQFAATDYQNPENLLYSYSFDGADWQHLGPVHSLTFAKMAPGVHKLRIKSTNGCGTWLDNTHEITIIVKPKFRETMMAKILMTLLLLGIGLGIFFTYRYIRGIKAKQHETLEAYLDLINAKTATPHPAVQPSGVTSNADDQFMKRIMSFIEQHISDPNADVDMMAAFTATSRSGLNRKLKSLVGMTPVEFIRESRMRRASDLLAGTTLPIKEIAAECGFSDINYFGKCFKSVTGVTPTAFRRNSQG